MTAFFVLASTACSGSEAIGLPPEASGRPERVSGQSSVRAGGGGEGSVHSLIGRTRRSAPLPAVIFEPEGREPVRVRAEIARTPAETRRGLMFRDMLEADAGMLFIFERPQQLSFWMRNTRIPLDMIFITSDFRVLGVVENAEPETDDPRQVEGRSQYVLEVNAGFARLHGIASGTPVRFENVPDLPRVATPTGERAVRNEVLDE